jgi:hypothetical protein
MRVEIAGSASKARSICEAHPPTLIIWDGVPNERGTREEYIACVPDKLWPRVVPISADDACLAIAKEKGSKEPSPKPASGHNSWSDTLVARLKVEFGVPAKGKKGR